VQFSELHKQIFARCSAPNCTYHRAIIKAIATLTALVDITVNHLQINNACSTIFSV